MINHTDSKLGIINKDYSIVKLGEIADITKLSGFEFTKHIDYVEDGEIIALRALNVREGILVLDKVKKIRKSVSDSLVRSKLFKGDILFTYVGANIGQFAMITENDKYHLAPNICRFRFDKELADEYFYFTYIRSQLFKDTTKGYIVGSSQPTLPMKNIRSIDVILPPLREQKKIAYVINRFDKKIKLNTNSSNLFEKLITNVFQSWFVKLDPIRVKAKAKEKGFDSSKQNIAAIAIMTGLYTTESVFDNFEITEKEVANKLETIPSNEFQSLKNIAKLFPSEYELKDDSTFIPQGWSEESLDSNIQFLNGLALQKFPPKGDKSDLPILKIAQLSKGVAAGGGYSSNEIDSKYMVNNGDLIFSWSASLMVKIWCGGECALNQHLFKVTSDKYPIWFQWQWCDHHLHEFQSIAKSKATTMGHIKRSHLKEAKIVVPPDDSITEFNKYFDVLMRGYINSQVESNQISRIRDQIIPKALSGLLDLSNLEDNLSWEHL